MIFDTPENIGHMAGYNNAVKNWGDVGYYIMVFMRWDNIYRNQLLFF